MAIPFHLALARTYHSQKNALRPRMGAVGLSLGQPKILFYLTHHNHCMQKDLAVNCDVEPATISRILNTMEDRGLIQRSIPKSNRRAVTISITPKGFDAYTQWEEICAEVEKTELQGFSPAEIEAFENYLNRLYKNFTGRDLE